MSFLKLHFLVGRTPTILENGLFGEESFLPFNELTPFVLVIVLVVFNGIRLVRILGLTFLTQLFYQVFMSYNFII